MNRPGNLGSDSHTRRNSYEAEFGEQVPQTSQQQYGACRIHGYAGKAATSDAGNTDDDGSSSSAQNAEASSSPPPQGITMRLHFCPEFQRAMESVHFIADHTRRYEEHISVSKHLIKVLY